MTTTKAEKAKEKAKDLHNQMLAGIDKAMQNPTEWTAYLKVATGFHDYSFGNQILIYTQMPTASLVAGFSKWKQYGRTVNRGEKSIRIWAPMTIKLKDEQGEIIRDEDGKPVRKTFFKPLPVFDIKQTSIVDAEKWAKHAPKLTAVTRFGVPVEKLTGPSDLAPMLIEAIERRGYTVHFDADLGTANGVTRFLPRRVEIAKDLQPAQIAKTLAHELAHIILHSPDATGPRPQYDVGEIEAESVAYLICQHLDLDSSAYSFGYIAGWSHNDFDAIKATCERVITAAADLMEELGTMALAA